MWEEVKYNDLSEDIRNEITEQEKSDLKMGSIYFKKRKICIFRIWVVKCKNVWLVNGETGNSYLMRNISDDVKEVILKNVNEYDKYYYIIETSSGEKIERRDPYSRYNEYKSDLCYVIDYLSKRDKHKNTINSEITNKNNLIIYELHVESYIRQYKNVFGNNNGNSYFRQIADNAIEYIKELNFNCIELMPVVEYCGEWGYNPRLMMSLNSNLGSIEDFEYLIEKSHSNGISIIVDIVLHHGASKMNSLWNYDGYDHKGGIYFEDGGDTGWGAKFNFHKKEIQEMLYTACDVFLGEYGIDGIRFDSVHNMPNWLLKIIIDRLRNKYKNKYFIAEIVPENPKYIKECGFDSCWIHSSYYDIISQYRNQKSQYDWNNGYCKSLIQGHSGFTSPYECILMMLGNHDQIGNRHGGSIPNGDDRIGRYVVDQFGGRNNWDARAYVRLLYSLSCISFGVPMLFMGTENLQGEWWSVSDDNHNYNWKLIKEKDKITFEMRNLVRDINYIKTNKSDIFSSNYNNFIEFNVNQNHLLVTFIREGSNDCACLCVVNMDKYEWLSKNYSVDISNNVANKYGNKIIQIFNSQSSEYGGWDGSYTGNKGEIINSQYNKEKNNSCFLLNIPKYSVTIYKFYK
ncbi:alpha-glucan branching enzyme [Cryptosporidium ryanae]|uniref:alpha-glucan branching enzyme n=1 Tax=Cryptosporidium ryanae TaxID=515981 RepID=UPI00351A2676|nr:alpha-glucan branching enzyme [Cryptosporidium ryanae]